MRNAWVAGWVGCGLLFACSPSPSVVWMDGDGAPPGTAAPDGEGSGRTPGVSHRPPRSSPSDPLPPPPQGEWALPALQTSLETWELTIPEATLQRFLADVGTPEQPATFTAGGKPYAVEVRLRGRSSRFFAKKSWKVEFPDDVKFQGRRKLNLVGMYQDSTMMVEKLALDLLAALGGTGPKAKFVRLVLNGKYQGVYVDVENVDKHFLKARGFFDDDADIYRCGTHDCEMKLFMQPYQSPWEKKTNESDSWAPLDDFLDFINHEPAPTFAAGLFERFDVDGYLVGMTVDSLMSNMTIEDSGSYLIRDRFRDLWTYVPWDYNNANSRFWPTYPLGMGPLEDHPLFVFSAKDTWIMKVHARRSTDPIFTDYLPAFSNLTTRVASDPVLKARALDLLERALDELFTEENLHPRIEALHALLDPHMAQDPYVDYEKFRYGRRYLKEYVTARIGFLRNELARLRSERPEVALHAFDPAAGWVELVNQTGDTLSSEGLSLRTHLRRPAGRLPPRSLPPGVPVRFTGSELGLSFAAEGELGLFEAGHVFAPVDILFYGALPQGTHYLREADGGAWGTTR